MIYLRMQTELLSAIKSRMRDTAINDSLRQWDGRVIRTNV